MITPLPATGSLPPDLSAYLFSPRTGHMSVPLTRPPAARVVWINRRAAMVDPYFRALGGDPKALCDHILESCAWVTCCDDAVERTPRIYATADRYGGRGIARNGGSGRSCVVGGYLVKGIGPTPLVSPLTSRGHAHGYAFLDECIREAIYSEIVASEFPFSGCPTLAIIDAGLMASSVTAERESDVRALLVRPCFLRPAHYERAIGFFSGHLGEGFKDAHRVEQMFRYTQEVYGRVGMLNIYETLWERWADQLAYSFVHRLPQGGCTTSNICLDGGLVDFGGMTALPNWAPAATALSGPPFGRELSAVARAIRSVAYYFGRYIDKSIAEDSAVTALIARATASYMKAVHTETLHLLGVARGEALEMVNQEPQLTNRISMALYRRYAGEQVNAIGAVPDPRVAADVDLLWSATPPPHLAPTATLLRRLIPEARHAGCEQSCRFRARVRQSLYRDRITTQIRAFLAQYADTPDNAEITAFINRQIVHGRRDDRHFRIPEQAIPFGFAVGPDESFALYRNPTSNQVVALPDVAPGAPSAHPAAGYTSAHSTSRAPGALLVTNVLSDGLELQGQTTVRCAVALSANQNQP